MSPHLPVGMYSAFPGQSFFVPASVMETCAAAPGGGLISVTFSHRPSSYWWATAQLHLQSPSTPADLSGSWHVNRWHTESGGTLAARPWPLAHQPVTSWITLRADHRAGAHRAGAQEQDRLGWGRLRSRHPQVSDQLYLWQLITLSVSGTLQDMFGCFGFYSDRKTWGLLPSMLVFCGKDGSSLQKSLRSTSFSILPSSKAQPTLMLRFLKGFKCREM